MVVLVIVATFYKAAGLRNEQKIAFTYCLKIVMCEFSRFGSY